MPETTVANIRALLTEKGDAKDPRALSHYLATIRPEDLAQILSEFRHEEQVSIFRHLDDTTMALVLDETDPQTKEELLEQVDNFTLGHIVELMPPDEGADLITALEPEEQDQVLQKVERSHAEEVRSLLQYDPETAGGIMTPHMAKTNEESTAGETIRLIQGDAEIEFINYVYVVNNKNILKGVVSLRTLLRSSPERPIREIMQTDVISTDIQTDQEEVARIVDRYNLQAVPVVQNGILTGIATFDDVVDVMVNEASEDMYRLAGSSNIHPTKESIFQRFYMRIPWLFIPLAGGLGVAIIQSHFEQRFEQVILLMLFTPAVIGMSGGVGLQSSTTVVRGLATGEIDMKRSFRMAMKEIAVGLLIALACGIISAFAVWLVISLSLLGQSSDPPWKVAMAVTLGLIAGMTMGAVTGTFIPLFCERTGVDPAFVAGPFTTTINDVVGSTCYLAIALSILNL